MSTVPERCSLAHCVSSDSRSPAPPPPPPGGGARVDDHLVMREHVRPRLGGLPRRDELEQVELGGEGHAPQRGAKLRV